MELPFVPIARRDLKFSTSPTVALDVILALSAPYRPAKTPMGSGNAACMVLTCDDPDLAIEVSGNDEFEALEMALIHLEKFLDTLSSDKRGKLLNQDGTPFEPKNVALFTYLLGKQTQPARSESK
jgi:hypothetical protein